MSAAEVPAAVRAVLASALGPGAGAYAEARGRAPGAPPVAVLIHRFVPCRGVGRGRLGSRPARAGPADRRPARAPEPGRDRDHPAQPGEPGHPLRPGGDRVGRHGRPGDVPAAAPYASPEPPPPWRGWHELDDGTAPEAWRWDAAHNPLPLSRAHAGLVAAVDERCRIGIRQRVLGGYLFWSPDGPQSPERLEPDELPAGAGPPDRGRRPVPGVAAGPAVASRRRWPAFCRCTSGCSGCCSRRPGRPGRRWSSCCAADRPQALALLPLLLSGVRLARPAPPGAGPRG